MMNCPNCNAPMPEGAKFCANCGFQIPEAPVQQPVYQEPAPQPQYQQPVQQPQYQQAPVQQPVYQQPAPAGQLKTNRALWKMILLGAITLGIYPLVVMTKITNELNLVASRYDGKKTMHYCLLFFVIAPITLGIASIVWTHKFCNRLGGEAARRGINYSFGAKDFWLWGVLGSLIIVGPFIFYHKMFKTSNLVNENYNMYG